MALIYDIRPDTNYIKNINIIWTTTNELGVYKFEAIRKIIDLRSQITANINYKVNEINYYTKAERVVD